MLLKQPYFMENKDWFYFIKDPKKAVAGKYHLTELGKSIPEVVKSHEEYYKILETVSDDPGFEYDTLKELEAELIEECKRDGMSEEEIKKAIHHLWYPNEDKI